MRPGSPSRATARVPGFTLIELLSSIAIIAVLTSLVLSSTSRTKLKGQSVKCLNNLKQIQLCWMLYTADYNDSVPPNKSVRTDCWRSTPDSWIGSSNAKHDQTTTNIMSGLLFQYDYNRSVALYVCPGDKSKVRNLDGSTMPATRTRSYSMNGLWGGRTSEKQAVINKVSEALTPESTFVLIDENEDSIDDAHFLVWPAPDKRWVNMPAGRHGQSGILSFADGHVEKWQWLSAKSFRNSDLDNYWKNAQPGADQKDLERLQLATIPPFQ